MWKVLLDDGPNDISINAEIHVDENIAHPADLAVLATLLIRLPKSTDEQSSQDTLERARASGKTGLLFS